MKYGVKILKTILNTCHLPKKKIPPGYALTLKQ